jgi:DNA helicase-2/ATP-dependent DNA helicase PcrA
MSIDFEQLNPAQQQAVETIEGPIMAIAGAGSGKTRVLTKRISYLVKDIGIPHMNILAITFTNKAAAEMKERIGHELKISTYKMWVSTFHAMCVRILRDHIEKIGYKNDFQILDDDDVLQLVKNIMRYLNVSTKVYDARMVKSLMQKVKTKPDILFEIEHPVQQVISDVLGEYNARLKRNNLVDFDGLLTLTIQLLKQVDDVRNYYHELFQYVHIDEFQDTNDIQYQLIKLLVNEQENIFIVGDEDQSIYAFRGANINNIKKFKKDFPTHQTILLEQNYRSTNTILKVANAIIKNNTDREDKNLFSSQGEGDLVTIYQSVTGRDEVEFVANEILSMNRKMSYNNMAVLYRNNATSRLFEEVFLSKRIPYRIVGNISFFKRKEVKDIMAYLRLLLSDNDELSIARVLSAPKRGIGNVTLDKWIRHRSDFNMTMFEAAKDALQFVGAGQAKKIHQFIEDIIMFRDVFESNDFSDFLDYLLDGSGYYQMLSKDDKKEIRLENIYEFKQLYQDQRNALSNELTKQEVLLYLLEDMSLRSEETKEDVEDGVSLMTLHSAKGLEFDVVFMVTLEMGIFPSSQSLVSLKDVEEERRLMYVGVTRAKKYLYLTHASSRFQYGSFHENDPSIFLSEIPEELVLHKGISVIEKPNTSKHLVVNQQRRSYMKPQKVTKNQLDKGDKVSHVTFGDGVVITVENGKAKIAFRAPHGIKILLKDHPSIKKIS